MTGHILRFERASIHDGPGLRTVVFLKGCPLRCQWCSTPESWAYGPQTDTRGTLHGRAMEASAVVREILKDEVFFFHSGGGVTLGGGEPLMQPAFAAEILRGCRQSGIHTALETSLWADFEAVSAVLPLVDHLFVDLKHSGAAAHKTLTGVDNTPILDNLLRLQEAGFRGDLVLRTPLVPGLNDDAENLRATARLAAQLPGQRSAELLAYHRLGLETYRRLAIPYPLEGISPPSRQHMDACVALMVQAAPGLTVQHNG